MCKKINDTSARPQTEFFWEAFGSHLGELEADEPSGGTLDVVGDISGAFGIWESSGRHLGNIREASTLGFPPLSRRCLLGAQGLLTNTVRIPWNWKCMLFICFCLFCLGGVWVALCRLHGWELWKRPGLSGNIAEALGGMWVQSGTRPSKTSQKSNFAHPFLYKFRPDLTL